MLAIDSTVVSDDFRLGYLSLDSNERSQFQARELKSVPWPTGLQVVVGHWGYGHHSRIFLGKSIQISSPCKLDKAEVYVDAVASKQVLYRLIYAVDLASQRNSACIVVALTSPLFVAVMPHIFQETPTPWSRCVLSILFRCQPSSSKSCFTSTVLSGSLTILEGISCDFIIFFCHDLVWILTTSCFSALEIHAIIVLCDHTPASRLALFQVPCESVQYCQSGAAVDFNHGSYQEGLRRMISQLSPMIKRCIALLQDRITSMFRVIQQEVISILSCIYI